MKKSTLINEDMLVPYLCSDAYSSVMLMGDELVGEHTININCGTLQPHTRLGGGTHEKAEIYYVVSCQPGAEVITGTGEEGDDEIHYKVQPGDTIFIPGGVFHWIDNRTSDEVFKILTLWPDQDLNEMYHIRQAEWGTSFKFKGEE